mgnify:CR=1 FL=1
MSDLQRQPDAQPETLSTRTGLFGPQGSGDTSGYGRLVRTVELGGITAPPYGGYFDDLLATLRTALAEHGVNLESLTTEVAPAPMSSEPLFHATALLAVPLDLSLDQLQDKLETLADDLMVELNLRSDE